MADRGADGQHFRHQAFVARTAAKVGRYYVGDAIGGGFSRLLEFRKISPPLLQGGWPSRRKARRWRSRTAESPSAIAALCGRIPVKLGIYQDSPEVYPSQLGFALGIVPTQRAD
jgi:hypothetical protein